MHNILGIDTDDPPEVVVRHLRIPYGFWNNGGSMSKPGKTSAETRESHAEDRQEAREEARARRKIDAYIERCRDLYQSPLISDATRRDYEDKVISFMETQATVEQASQNVQWAMDTLVKAARAREFFEAKLERATEAHWISRESADRWVDRFNDPSLIQWEREKWLYEEFPAYCTRWRDVAESRTRTLSNADRHELRDSEEPGLAVLRNRDAFLRLDYAHRRELVARVDALILSASSRTQETYRSIRGTLQSAARGSEAVLPSSQVGVLLKSALSAEDPQAYFDRSIAPMLARRAELRASYDALSQSLSDGAPEGLRMPSVPQFLRWNEDACETFLAEAKARVELAEREQKGERQELDARKKEARALTDMQDWDGAERAIAALSAEHPADDELKAMRRFVQEHRQEPSETPDPQVPQVMEHMRSIVRTVPAAMQGMYQESLERGSLSFTQVMQHMYMAVWKADRQASAAPLMPERPEAELAPVAAEPAPEPELEDAPVIVQRVTADGEQPEPEEQTAPAVLAVSNDAESQVKALDLIETSDAQAHASDYSGIVTESVTLKHQRYLVDHVNAPLLQQLRLLEEQGERFAMAA